MFSLGLLPPAGLGNGAGTEPKGAGEASAPRSVLLAIRAHTAHVTSAQAACLNVKHTVGAS